MTNTQNALSGIEFIRTLHAPSTNQFIEAKIIISTENHAAWWAKHVQPEIQKDDSRPDKAWNWIALNNASHPLLKIAHYMGQKSHQYCIVTADPFGNEIPVAMLLLVEPYPFLLDHTKKAPFLWFLTAAPREVLVRYLNGKRPMLMQALIDVGIVISHKKDYSGRIGLHADAKGGDALAARYAQCGLQILGKTSKLPASRTILEWVSTLFRRNQHDSNQGAYFYADIEHAEQILKRSDHLRTYPPTNP